MPRKTENSTSIDEAAKLRRHQHIIIDLGVLASQTLTLDAFLNHAVTQVARALEVSNTKIMRFRPEHGDLLMVAGIGWKNGIVGHATFPIDLASLPGRAFQTGDPVVIDDIAADTEFRVHRTLSEHGIVSVVNVPILIGGAAWGVLEADNKEQRDFREDTVDFLLLVSRMIASVIEREQAEQAHTEALARIASQAKHHELVLREMQHRVKNYFQLILSMVAMQRPKMASDGSRQVIDQIAERVLAVALAHDQLSSTQGMRIINLPNYLRALCASIEAQRENIRISVQADEMDVPAERAVPVGLIVNELVTNSIKHAFDENGGSISVGLSSAIGSNRAVLTVSDSGRGFDQAKASGSGLKLLRLLARQIAGEVEQETSDAGTTTRVTFVDGE